MLNTLILFILSKRASEQGLRLQLLSYMPKGKNTQGHVKLSTLQAKYVIHVFRIAMVWMIVYCCLMSVWLCNCNCRRLEFCWWAEWHLLRNFLLKWTIWIALNHYITVMNSWYGWYVGHKTWPLYTEYLSWVHYVFAEYL